MKTVPREKPRIVPVSDPDEIASIKRNGDWDIYGGRDGNGGYWAYAWSLERWRKRSREEAK